MWPNPNYQLEFSRPAFAWQLLRWPGAVLVMLLGVLVAVKYAGVTDTEAQLQQLAQRQLSFIRLRLT